MFEVLIALAIIGVIPIALCGFLAKGDAAAGRRRSRGRVLVAALLSVLAFVVLVLAKFQQVKNTPRPPGVYVGLAWGQVLVGCVVVMVVASAIGAIVYAVGYRYFFRGSVTDPKGLESPAIRTDETGNPYQPPTV